MGGIVQRLSAQAIDTSGAQSISEPISLGFERVLNTFVWNGNLGFTVGDTSTSLVVRQGLRSKLIRSVPVSTQGEYNGFLGLRSGLGGGWVFLGRTSSLVVSDNRSIDLGRLAQHQGLLGAGFSAGDWNLSALGGYELNAQEGEIDRGPALELSMAASGLRFEEIRAALSGEWQKSYLGRRAPEEENLALGVGRSFGEGGSDTLLVRYSTQRREFYTAATPGIVELYSVGHNIFRRDATSYELSDQLTYKVGAGTSLAIRGGIQNRNIDRAFLYKDFQQPSTITLDTRIRELILNGSASMSSQIFNWLLGTAGVSFQERDEHYAVVDLDGVPASVVESQQLSARRLEYTSRQTSAWASVVSPLSGSDLLVLSGSASILRYDTPDSLNIDDRDVLLLAYMVQETHRFNEYLTLGLSINASLNHLVYIDRLQSANNNWNRVLSFSPQIVLKPADWLVSSNVGEVVANYTVYDFEAQVASVRSYSFRQASWSDSTFIRLSRNIDLDFSGGLRVYERGILRWEQFKEKPMDYFVEKSFWPRLIYKANADLTLSVGYRHFSQEQFVYDGPVRNFLHSIVSTGPTAEVRWFGPGGTNLSISGWSMASYADSKLTGTVPNLSLSISSFF